MTYEKLIAFEGTRRIAQGAPTDVVAAAKLAVDAGGCDPILIFDAETSSPVEIDFRGSLADVLARLNLDDTPPQEAPRGPGRPKLGVVSREVTLLPRHWEWLREQPGGASVVLRRLVDQARRETTDKERNRIAVEAAYRFMISVGGNLPEFEEATRALFARSREDFGRITIAWPDDVRAHVISLAFDIASDS